FAAFVETARDECRRGWGIWIGFANYLKIHQQFCVTRIWFSSVGRRGVIGWASFRRIIDSRSFYFVRKGIPINTRIIYGNGGNRLSNDSLHHLLNRALFL